jgi:hypothetical protein
MRPTLTWSAFGESDLRLVVPEFGPSPCRAGAGHALSPGSWIPGVRWWEGDFAPAIGFLNATALGKSPPVGANPAPMQSR